MHDLTKGTEWKSILVFSLPFLVGNLFQQFYNVVDSIVVGKVLNKESLAAVGFCFQINSLLIIISIGITMGTSILISKCIGSSQLSRLKRIMDTGLAFSLAISLVCTILLILFSNKILHIFRMPKETLALAGTYLRIVSIGMIPTFGYNTLTNILRGMGDSKTPTNILIVSALLNIVLDILLVAILPMGVAGAAIATVISQFFSWFACMAYMNHKYPQLKIRLTRLQFSVGELTSSLKLGIPIMLQQVFISVGFLIIQYLINGFGTDCIAAFTAASKIDAFAEMPALNLGKAMTNYVAQNLGAQRYDRVRRGCKASILMCIAVSVAISAVIIAMPTIFISFFTKDSAVIGLGNEYLRVVGFFYCVFGLMQVVNGILLGSGKTLIPMLASILSLCLLQVPVAVVLSETALSTNGIWIAAPIGWIGGLLIRFIYYKRSSLMKLLKTSS